MSDMVRGAYGKDLEEYIDGLNELSKSGKKVTADINGMNSVLVKNGKQAIQTDTIWNKIGKGIASFGKTALKTVGNIGFDVVVSYGLQKAAEAWSDYSNMQENAIERGNKALQDYATTNQNMRTATSWIEENKERYVELGERATSLGEQGSLTDAEFEEYNQLSSQLATYLPDQITGYNSLGTAIVSVTNGVDGLNEALTTEKLTQYTEAANAATDVIDKFKAEMYQDASVDFTKEAGITDQMKSIEMFRKDYESGNLEALYGGNLTEAMRNAGIKPTGMFGGFQKEDFQNEDNYETLISYYEQLETQAETSAAAIREVMPAFLQADRDYQELITNNSQLDSMVGMMINGLDRAGVEAIAGAGEDISTLGTEEIKKNIRNWSADLVDDLKRQDTQEALTDLFALDDKRAEMSYSDYEKAATDAIKAVTDETDAFTEAQLKQTSGIHNRLDQMMTDYNEIKNRFKDDAEFSEDYLLDQLTSDELSTLADLAIDDSFTGTYQQALTQIQEIQRASQLSLEAMQSNVTSAQENLSSFSTALSESASATGLTEDSITALGTAFADLENYNTDAVFTRSAEGMKLNTEALEGFIDAQHRVKEQDFADAIQEQNKAILEQQEAIRSNTDITEDEITAKEAELDTMYDQLDAMKRAQSEYNALYQQQKALMSDYQQILDAESTENAGAHYEGIQSRLETYKEMYDKGLVGADEFKEFASYLSPNEFTDATNFLENYGKAIRYLTEDKSGVINFLNDLESKGLATLQTLDDGTQQWLYNFTDTEDAAMQMGMGHQWFMDMFGRLEDYDFVNTFAETATEAELGAEETASKLAEAISRKAQLEAQGANQATLDSQQELIDQLTGQYEGYLNTQDQLLASEPQKYAQSLQYAKEELDTLSQEIDKASGPLREKLIDQYEGIASQYGIKYDPDTFTVDNDTYQASLRSMGVGTWETPLTAEAMGFKEGSQEAQDYESSINALKQAHEANNAETENALDILSKYNEAQLEGIELGDGAYNVKGMEEAEDALQNLADQTGLTKDQLVSALQGLGIIKPEIDTTSLDDVQTKGEEAQRTFNELTGKSYKFDFETTNLDTIQQQIDTIKQELGQYQTTGANGEVTYDYSQPGAQEAADMYEASIRQQQYAEYQGSAMGQYESDNNIVKATQSFMQAKNELDIQTQLASEGMANDVEGATQNATTAFQALQDLGLGDWIDLTDLQSAEDSIQGLSQEEIDVKVGADTSGAEGDISNLQNLSGSVINLQVDVSGEENVQQAKEIISTIPPNTSANFSVQVDGEEDVENTVELIEAAPKNQNSVVTFTIDGDDPSKMQEILEAANAANAGGANVQIEFTGKVGKVDTSTASANQSQPVDLKGVVKDVTVEAETDPVELTGKIKANLDTSGLHQEQVAIVGQVVQVTGNPQTPVNVNGNLQSVNTDGVDTPNIDVTGTLTSVDPNGQTATVNVSGILTGGIQNTDGQDGVVNFTADTSDPDSYQPDDKEATAVFDKDSSIPDSYQPDDKSAKVNYGLGSTPNYDPPDLTRTVTYTIKTIDSPPSGGAVAADGTMTSVAHAHADGTAYNVLNMKPISPAHARGDITLPKNEKALVNEVGTESIVRDGVWSLLPGGAHIETLKKGDIIFSAAQTEALLKYGKINGHARAYAAGSLETSAPQSLYNAYAAGGGFGSFKGGLSDKSTSSSSTSSNKAAASAQKANTEATQANTKATEENAEAAEESISVYDWVERKLQYFSQKVQEIADTITDWVSPLTKSNLLFKQVSAVNKEMQVSYTAARKYYEKAQAVGLDATTRKQIEEGKYDIEEIDTSTDAGKKRYEDIQEYQEYYDKYIDCINAVRELRAEQVELFKQWADMPTEAAEKKIEKLEQSFNGLTAIEARLSAADLGGSTQAALVQVMTQMRKESESAYQTARNNLLKAKEPETAAATLNNKNQKTLQNAEKQLKNSVTLTADEKKRIAAGQALSTKGLTEKKKTLVTKYNNALKQANASQKQYDSAHANANEYRNAYMGALNARNEYKKQYDEAMKYYNAGDSLSYQNYLVDAQVRNIQAQMEAYEEAYSQAMKNTQTATTRRDAYQKTIQNIKNRGANYAKRYAKYLSDTQIKQLQSGQKVSLGGLNNKNLLNAFRKYNIDLQNAINSYQASLQQLAAAQESEAEAAANAAQSQAEYVQSLIEAEQTKFENVENHYEKLLEYQKALNEYAEQNIEFWEAQGAYISSDQYATALEAARKEQDAAKTLQWRLQSQLNSAVASGVIKEGSDEWLEMATAVKEAENAVMDYEIEIQKLYQQQIDAKYFELFDHALEQADKFIDKLSTINSLLKDEMLFDYDTGELTEMGALSIVINSRQLNDTLDNIKTLIKKRQQIYDDAYNGVFGEKKYEELTAEVDEEIQAALKNADAYRDAIVEIIKDQAENELDALYKVIDARKEALKKKKEYYDYDKQLKSQTKEINLLEQQIAALDGVTDAESRAQKARLEAQLKEQQDELDDTVRDHVYELQIDGLDDLKDQLSEDFDEWAYNLKSSVEEISNAITEAVENVGGTASDTLIAINEILKEYGISLDDMGISAGDIMMKHYAKGTNKVQHKEVAMTNEEGRELILTKDGLITTLYPGEAVLNNKTATNLVKMAQMASMDDMTKNISVPAPEVIMNSQTPSFSVNQSFTVQGDLTRDTLPNLETILDKASQRTQNDMRKNMRRFG